VEAPARRARGDDAWQAAVAKTLQSASVVIAEAREAAVVRTSAVTADVIVEMCKP